MKVFLSVAASLLCVVAAQDWVKPDFCKENECPAFRVIDDTNDGYEIREYGATKWVVTDYKANFLTRLIKMNMGFMSLFYYIQGDNKNGTKVDMTAPVRVNEYNCKQVDCTARTHSIGFYVPAENAQNPPEPLSDDIQVIEVPAKKYYVRSYGGFSTTMRMKKELRELKKAINDDSAYDSSYFVMSGYNSPMDMVSRHNEVMVEANN